jgi:DNA processing protein
MKDELLMHQIALRLLPDIGPVLAKNLISYCGGVQEIFHARKSRLEKVPGIGPALATKILGHTVFERAAKEVDYIKKNNIATLFYFDAAYPERLKRCHDAPVMLFYKGAANLNAARIVSIVGTRNATPYGLAMTDKLVEDLAAMHVIVVSGMAYGIDVCAHRAALKYDVPTVAVFGHGLDRVYPAVHQQTAENIVDKGGLLSEYLSATTVEKTNFPMRNRLVAGLADATIIMEASRRGGALITAELANSYNRDVFAFPGRTTDQYSQGCNGLIKQNKAVLIESAKDLEYIMGWEVKPLKKILPQQVLFIEHSHEENIILNLFSPGLALNIDFIIQASEYTAGKVAGILLNLEFQGYLKSLPGKMYILV